MLFVAACGGDDRPPPVAGSPAWLAEQSPDARAEYYATLCAGQGYAPGTLDFVNCVQDQSASFKLQLVRNDFSEAAM